MPLPEEIRQLLRELRFSLIRYEEDSDLDSLEDARAMLEDIHKLETCDDNPS